MTAPLPLPDDPRLAALIANAARLVAIFRAAYSEMARAPLAKPGVP